MNWEKRLIESAIDSAKKAYAPYSGYHVGVALLTNSGVVYTGCNIENASYGATNCAERTAFFKAVSDEEKDFEAIAIVGGPREIFLTDVLKETDARITFSDYAYPCGICRQVMKEFCSDDFKIIVAKSTDDYFVYTLKDLLPHGFGGSVK